MRFIRLGVDSNWNEPESKWLSLSFILGTIRPCLCFIRNHDFVSLGTPSPLPPLKPTCTPRILQSSAGGKRVFFICHTQFLRICNKKSGLESTTCVFFSKWTVWIESRFDPTHENASQVSACKNTRPSRDFPTVSIHVKVPMTYFDNGGSEFSQISTWFLCPIPLCHVSTHPL